MDRTEWETWFHKNTLCTKKEYRKEFIEACLQKRDNECDLVQVTGIVK